MFVKFLESSIILSSKGEMKEHSCLCFRWGHFLDSGADVGDHIDDITKNKVYIVDECCSNGRDIPKCIREFPPCERSDEGIFEVVVEFNGTRGECVVFVI